MPERLHIETVMCPVAWLVEAIDHPVVEHMAGRFLQRHERVQVERLASRRDRAVGRHNPLADVEKRPHYVGRIVPDVGVDPESPVVFRGEPHIDEMVADAGEAAAA